MVGTEDSYALVKFCLNLGLFLSVLGLEIGYVLSMLLFKSRDLSMQLSHLVTCVSWEALDLVSESLDFIVELFDRSFQLPLGSFSLAAGIL